jgi:nicotinate-nucleotide adenylyltransferase
MRTGLFGGTFDPVHLGHLDVVHAARIALGLDRVLMVPSRVPPHRSTTNVSAAHRFAMVALAVQEESGVVVSDLEMASTGPSFTIDTLDRYAAGHPDMSSTFFVLGADAFRDIRIWKDFPRVLDRCHFAVVSRPGQSVAALRGLLPDLASRMHDTPCEIPAQPGILLVDAPTAPVSSTSIREAIRLGRSLGGLVPASVERYIVQHGLYRPEHEPDDRFKGVA